MQYLSQTIEHLTYQYHAYLKFIKKQKKRKNDKKNVISLLSYDASCVSLNLSLSVACGNCKSKLEGKIGFGRNKKFQKTNFRHISERNKCEQRWTMKCVLTKNASALRYKHMHLNLQ